jgi:hypothetical protein
MVELIINDAPIELSPNTSIKYSKQISDIFDLAKVASSFTNSFDVEKSPNNTQAMKQLGISGDGSNIPYQKNTTELKVDGFHLVEKGWANVSETSDTYKVSIIDGMIDFFKAIENKTLGLHLDFVNFNHIKTFDNVLDSFTNDYYKYLVADYGGKNIFADGINIDYQTPCFSVRKLWELIFSTFNFNCDYTNLSYLDGLFITYPKDVNESSTLIEVARLKRNPFVSTQVIVVGDTIMQDVNTKNWNSAVFTEGSRIVEKYIIGSDNSFTFKIIVENYVKYRRSNRADREISPTIYVYKNNSIIGSIISDFSDSQGEEREVEFIASCEAGDVISVQIVAPRTISRRPLNNNPPFRTYSFKSWHSNNVELIISKIDLGVTNLANELKDFSIINFIKEIVWRTGLTPVYKTETNTVNFITLNSRIDFENAIDMSNTFVSRKSENYTNGYAQKNAFALKKNNDFNTEGDGFILVPNVNLSDYKVIAQSVIFAPDKLILTDFLGIKTNQYKIWETETKINNNNDIEVNYKGLSGRFYFVRLQENTGSFKFTSEKLEDSLIVSSFPSAINNNTLFDEAIFNNYSEYQKIFNNFRTHNIKQVLSFEDFQKTDLEKPIFFKQENAYYICNKISFEEGKETLNEYVKINKLESLTGAPDCGFLTGLAVKIEPVDNCEIIGNAIKT